MATTAMQLPQNLSTLQQVELDMMADMYGRMTESCRKKCVKPEHKAGELNKGESVCLDRCIVKYFQMHENVGKSLRLDFNAK
jgi:import inner membrane translocase subunit TIM10